MPSRSSAQQKLIARLRHQDPAFWSILGELARTSEEERCRILRPNVETVLSKIRDRDLLDKRERLDQVLDALTLLEIAFQTGVASNSGSPFAAVAAFHELVLSSEAFLLYADAYLYFGIRFLAGRLFEKPWDRQYSQNRSVTQRNNRSFALLVPPPLTPLTSSAELGFTTLLEFSQGDDESLALRFLNDFTLSRDDLTASQRSALNSEPEKPSELNSRTFELSLRGLLPRSTFLENEVSFADLRLELATWAIARCNFYLSLQPQIEYPGRSEDGDFRPFGGWLMANPITARFALGDMYWIARLLRAEIASGSVTYASTSWLHLLRFHETLGRVTSRPSRLESDLRRAEEVLRAVFEFGCDLVQNALQLTEDVERQAVEPAAISNLPKETAKWRQVFDEEVSEILLQRSRREARDPILQEGDDPSHSPPPPLIPHDGWSDRIRTGRQPHSLIGLAFSGGGIRSASFNLGVLEELQQLDLLRYIDYLSTVSGGGFIGGWLIANVKRSNQWLSRLTSWKESVSHLRRYSNYLAPKSGLLASDVWTMWSTWISNAFLIQLTSLAWLITVLLIGLAGHELFGYVAGPWIAVFGGFSTASVLGTTLWNLSGYRARTGKGAFSAVTIQITAVIPACVACFLLAKSLWLQLCGDLQADGLVVPAYSSLVQSQWRDWLLILCSALVAFILLGIFTVTRRSLHVIWIAIVCVAVLYLGLCIFVKLFMSLLLATLDKATTGYYVYCLGPTLVLAVFTLAVVLFIGLTSRDSTEAVREWWMRLGALVVRYGLAFLIIPSAAIFGPQLVLGMTTRPHLSLTGVIVVSWIGTVIGGLYAGDSKKTAEKRRRLIRRESLQKLAGLAFLVGAVLLVSAVLYICLANIELEAPTRTNAPWQVLSQLHGSKIWIPILVIAGCGLLFSWCFDINLFGLNQFYRNRLVRCYLGASRWIPGVRKPQPFTKFDENDDIRLSEFRNNFPGPFPILNCALNLGGSSDLSLHTRHSASFFLTPLRCGTDRMSVGFAPTKAGSRAFADGVNLGQAMAISGAAASPNMGYNTSPLAAFLLTVFNVRLGWWFPNPGKASWYLHRLPISLYYLTKELFGFAGEDDLFLNVSDGGHFENLGIYELVRRRCKVIIASDAECDEALQFGSLGNVIRLCETDFGAKIEIDVDSIRRQPNALSRNHCAVGQITYSNGSIGHLVYFKASLTGDENTAIAQYRSTHAAFPHEGTADQFFSEDQFESYRKLGQHVIRQSVQGSQPGDHPVDIAEKLADMLAPSRSDSETFVKHTEMLNDVWDRLRQSSGLHRFVEELMGNACSGASSSSPASPVEELCAGLELIQLMENVLMDLRLDDFWNHPDNRGWAMLFMQWARSPRFQAIWAQTRRTFGIRLEYFCAERLGLQRDDPIMRV